MSIIGELAFANTVFKIAYSTISELNGARINLSRYHDKLLRRQCQIVDSELGLKSWRRRWGIDKPSRRMIYQLIWGSHLGHIKDLLGLIMSEIIWIRGKLFPHWDGQPLSTLR